MSTIKVKKRTMKEIFGDRNYRMRPKLFISNEGKLSNNYNNVVENLNILYPSKSKQEILEELKMN